MLRKYRINRNADISLRRPDKDIERAKSGGLDPEIDDDRVGRHAVGARLKARQGGSSVTQAAASPCGIRRQFNDPIPRFHNDKLLSVMRQAHFKDRRSRALASN